MKDEAHLGAWALTDVAVAARLDVDVASGLTGVEVSRRLSRHGPNRLREHARRSGWSVLFAQFKNLLALLLVVAAGLSFAFGQVVEGVAIVLVLLVNAGIGFATELSALRSMDALRRLGAVDVTVRRDGVQRVVPAQSLVPGDVVLLEGGDIVTADLRLVEASKLEADESTLTGESMPVAKSPPALAEDVLLADRSNMLYKGTAVTRGAGVAIVVATGMATELGRISRLVDEAKDETTPLEKRLDALGERLVWLTIVVAALVAVAGVMAGKDTLFVIETAIALAVASVPEGLPIVATIALARGMLRLARRNALLKRLSAVETLGAVTVIITDKTGTLTENRMTVSHLVTADGQHQLPDESLAGAAAGDPARRALEVGALCNNAALSDEGGVGDPLEVALLRAAASADITRADLVATAPEVHEVAFDAALKMMATFHRHRDTGRLRVAVKGAFEAVVESCSQVASSAGPLPLDDAQIARWDRLHAQMASRGLRVLALAEGSADEVGDSPYQGLALLGIVGLQDPARSDAAGALKDCHEAGVRTVMATGDHADTARSIAEAVGLCPERELEVLTGGELAQLDLDHPADAQRVRAASILARVNPAQKLDLVKLHQAHGEIVAMTGDGVNDGPALKQAEIGVAMGRRGTAVAREAAEMVLKDDAFSSIVVAIGQGRVIFANIRAFVMYLLSCNLSEILVIGLASAVAAPLPLLPLQILFLNLVTDVFPALALGVGEGDEATLRVRRAPDEPIVGRGHWWAVIGWGLMITAATLSAFAIALVPMQLDGRSAVTIAFLTLAFAQLWHVFDLRDYRSNILSNAIVANRWVWGALALCVMLLMGAVFVGPIAEVLKLTPPDATGWTVVGVASLAPMVLVQVAKVVRKHLG